ncbi:ExeM/NucH family extracellular endonuclease [Microbacterium rhizomatis]|uniref:ExeM/NucH family extracellular endonuclease n=1 Tax=Microbacterium rhizomatis TaxID=1631477 RepID=UPI001FE734B9|nr:ExeM/NucH family extracellular endonuclease [Microbacterium rhizomatis]
MIHPLGRRRLAASVIAASALIVSGLAAPATAQAEVGTTARVLINEVYGGGGNSGATLANDFVELYNPTDVAVDLSAWSVQYASAAGVTFQSTPLTGTIAPHAYFLVAEAAGAGGTAYTFDLKGSIPMSAASGVVALVGTQTALTGCGTACASSPDVIDLVGYGATANAAGGSAAPSLSNTTSASRSADHANTAVNSADFTSGAPSPTTAAGQAVPIVVNPPDPGPDPVVATIAAIQGTGVASPLAGQTVTTRGTVTASYPTGGLVGYVIQTPGTGGALDLTSHTASDALFVYSPAAPIQPIGAYVEVTGSVTEFGATAGNPATLTELTASSVTVLTDVVAPPTPATVAWPANDSQRESLESMLVSPQGAFTVSNTFSTNQYGEVGLASGTTPLRQPTDLAAPGTPEAAAVAADNAARAVVLDDGASTNFLSAANRGLTPAYIALNEPPRVGASVTFTAPVIVDWRNSAWKFNPTAPVVGDGSGVDGVVFANTRTPAPAEVGGDFSVASFNVLNYFTTLGDLSPSCKPFTDRVGDGVTVDGAVSNDVVCLPRGAWDAPDLARQQAKIVAAINALDASVVGLMEIENSLVVDEATATLVDALNAAAGAAKWAYVPSSADLPPASEMDVITNAIIYQPAKVTRVGASRALGTQSAADEAFGNAREPIAQVFRPAAGGEDVLFVVNHFKSKGSAGPWPGDADTGDGQGSSNESRVRQATALRDWVEEIRGGVTSVALAGDFNSYGQEDPLRVLYAAGYSDAERALGIQKSSYSFSGLSGSLDHVLLSGPALTRATGGDIWNINSGEAVALEYSRYNYHGTLFYAPDPYRSSDHDPVKVGLDAGTVASTTTLALDRTTFEYGAAGTVRAMATVAADGGIAAEGSVEFAVDGTVVGTAALAAGSATIALGLPGSLPAGAHTIEARFTGSAGVAPSTSAPVTITVAPAHSTTSLLALPPLHLNRLLPATLVARVTLGSGIGAPGTVEFREGSTVIGTSALVNGRATFRLPNTLGRGIHGYTAVFVPADAVSIAGSTSATAPVIVLW